MTQQRGRPQRRRPSALPLDHWESVERNHHERTARSFISSNRSCNCNLSTTTGHGQSFEVIDLVGVSRRQNRLVGQSKLTGIDANFQ